MQFTDAVTVAGTRRTGDGYPRSDIGKRLERGDINGAIAAMHLDEAALRPLDEAIRQAFNGNGVATVEQMPALRDPEGHRFVIRVDARNVEAENWLRYHSTTLVSNIIADQQECIRTALQAGLERGDNPTRKALDVVGRLNRVTGRREGGLIGLTASQGNAVARARQELLSGQPDQLRSYLTRGRRDTRNVGQMQANFANMATDPGQIASSQPQRPAATTRSKSS